MGLEIGISLLEDIFFKTNFIGQNWLTMFSIILGSMALITRQWKDWGVLSLPVMAGWWYFGMPVPYMFFIIASIIFTISVLSVDILTGALTGFGEGIMKAGRLRFTTKGKQKRMDVKMEMAKKEKEYERLRAKGFIPFERGTSISDAIERGISQKKEYILEKRKQKERSID